MTYDEASQIKADEGLRLRAYGDPLTGAEPWTCGYGCTGPDVGPTTVWTQEEADANFERKHQIARAGCESHFAPWFQALNAPRQAVLVNMAYQMGVGGLLEFRHALTAIRDQRWHDALGQMMDSTWAKQTHGRAWKLAKQMESGEWEA